MPIADQVSTAEFAKLVGVSERTVREYAARGLIARSEKNRFATASALARLFEHFRAVASQHRSDSPTDDDPTDLTLQRALLAHAQRQRIEREEQVALGLLLDAKKAEESWYEEMRAVRDALMNIPDRIAPNLVGIDNLHDVRELLLAEITEVCQSLAEG